LAENVIIWSHWARKGIYFMNNMRLSHDYRSLTVSLNGLKAFESAARHLSFTAAATELGVTQSAVSHQIKQLEDRLGTTLFRRTPRGLAITDEALALAPTLTEAFERIAFLLAQFGDGKRRVPLTISVVGTFALGWLLPRLPMFEQACPFVDLRLLTNNNNVDVVGEGLDAAIRFGDGAWGGIESRKLIDAEMSPLCSPTIAVTMSTPADLAKKTLLRSFRGQDWLKWLKAAGLDHISLSGPVFDSSFLMAEAAARGHGVAMLPISMFENDLANGRLVRPFDLSINAGSYWLLTVKSRERSAAMTAFTDWIVQTAGRDGS
jgi:LysR family transcriptional regulator, regulator of gene expression of beta-lactamase